VRSALVDVDVDVLRQRGFVRHSVAEDLRPFAEGGFATASGRAELWSDALAEAGHGALPQFVAAKEGRGGELSDRYPLSLMTPKIHTRFLNSSYSHLPRHGGMEEGPWVELSPEDAAVRSIGAGDRVRVWNDRGSLTVPARIGTLVREGVVAVPFGWWADAEGASANSLTNDAPTDWGGGVAYSDTLVQVEKA
jgi:anaerobic selenocysteine-containing dehydrogenase